MRRHWMPATVFCMGILSVALLIWTKQINDRQAINYVLVDVIMDVQIQASKFHLMLEEFLGGDAEIQKQDIWDNINRAETVVDAILYGGQSHHGSILEPLTDTELKNSARRLKFHLTGLRDIALERLRDPAKMGIASSMEQLFDSIYEQVLAEAGTLEKMLEAEKVRNRAKTRRIFLGILVAWASLVTGASAGLLVGERRRRVSEDALRTTHERLLVQAGELRKHRYYLKQTVDERTEELRSANESLRLEVKEHAQAEEALKASQKQLQYVSGRLLSAQEEERRRVARELHDGLGQSLTLMKVQLRSVEKRLPADQGALREDCRNIMQYIGDVMEDVRRLARDLSPCILEDLGLTRALRWLVNSFDRDSDLRITLDTADIDYVFSREAQTSIYRLMQEALTNIVKHSGAGRVWISIQKGEGRVAFSVRDNGKGFDAKGLAVLDVAKRGLGLAGMEERVKMLGGTMEIESRKGNGAHVRFILPFQEGARDEQVSHFAGSGGSA